MKPNAFSGFHPAVNLTFFGIVIGLTMFLMHPIFLAVSLTCGCAYLWHLVGGRGFARQAGYLIPVVLFMAALNPMFNHQGQTVLFLLPNESPVTLESVCYGLASAAMMGASIPQTLRIS